MSTDAPLDRPLDRVRAGSLDELQHRVRDVIADDLHQHVDPAHTPHLGAFVAMLSVYAQITPLAVSGALTARSQDRDLGRWQSFFNAVASGPPGFRVRQLLALSRAGYVRFLGAGMTVEVADGQVEVVDHRAFELAHEVLPVLHSCCVTQ